MDLWLPYLSVVLFNPSDSLPIPGRIWIPRRNIDMYCSGWEVD